MAFLLLATFVTADFILNINHILFMLECVIVRGRFYSETFLVRKCIIPATWYTCGLVIEVIDVMYLRKLHYCFRVKILKFHFTPEPYKVAVFWRSKVVIYWEFHLIQTNKNSREQQVWLWGNRGYWYKLHDYNEWVTETFHLMLERVIVGLLI